MDLHPAEAGWICVDVETQSLRCRRLSGKPGVGEAERQGWCGGINQGTASFGSLLKQKRRDWSTDVPESN